MGEFYEEPPAGSPCPTEQNRLSDDPNRDGDLLLAADDIQDIHDIHVDALNGNVGELLLDAEDIHMNDLHQEADRRPRNLDGLPYKGLEAEDACKVRQLHRILIDSDCPRLFQVIPALKKLKNAPLRFRSGQSAMVLTYEGRLQSFTEENEEEGAWPGPSPESMAEAGWYRVPGYKDRAMCHFCTLGIREWIRGDNPSKEHVQWSPLCPFLLREGRM